MYTYNYLPVRCGDIKRKERGNPNIGRNGTVFSFCTSAVPLIGRTSSTNIHHQQQNFRILASFVLSKRVFCVCASTSRFCPPNTQQNKRRDASAEATSKWERATHTASLAPRFRPFPIHIRTEKLSFHII